MNEPGEAPDLPWTECAVMVLDLVESVRLMQDDEEGAIRRWLAFVAQVRERLLPRHGGTLVKSLGDGLMLSFDTVPQALRLAFELPAVLAAVNRGVPAAQQLSLRTGLHHARVMVTALDIYGRDVNLCARIAAVAQPGQLLTSAAARDRLVPGLHAEVEDLGDCFLKHVEGSCRLFRLRPPAGAAVVPAGHPPPTAPLRPRLGLLPWTAGPGVPPALAPVLVDHLAATLGRMPQWLVTSRLSTAALQGHRFDDLETAGRVLGVDYLLTGQVESQAGQLRARLSLRECHRGAWLWEEDYRLDPATALDPAEPLVQGVAAALAQAIVVQPAVALAEPALPTLTGYALLLGGVGALYSCDRERAPVARQLLQDLVDRHPRSAEARVWLAKWHFMRLAQQTTTDREADAARARDLLARALDAAPTHAMALALAGHMKAYVDGDTAAAEPLLRQAVAAGPNEPLAPLFLSQLLRNLGRAQEAVQAVERAQALSPLDPMGYYYDLFAASAHSAAGQHEQALALALRSLRQNALHLSTWVQVIIEQVLTGRMEDARASARRYLEMRPKASVSRYLERHPARGRAIADQEASALRAAGLPM